MQAKDGATPGDEAKLTRMLLAMADVRVVLIVLAARLHQLRGLAGRRPGGSPESALADEMLLVFAPLANRLGVWSLKAEMEDLCFQVGDLLFTLLNFKLHNPHLFTSCHAAVSAPMEQLHMLDCIYYCFLSPN